MIRLGMLSLLLAVPLTVNAGVFEGLFPAGYEDFYYDLGGGESLPRSYVKRTHRVKFDVGIEAGLGWDCGGFDPEYTIKNALNNFKDSLHNVGQSIVKQATSAIINYPMYELMRSDPNLYNQLNNILEGAKADWDVNIRTCEEMSAIALDQKNPYEDWMKVSRVNAWKEQAKKEDDLNIAKDKIDKDEGKSGVPWPVPGGAKKAGGLGQPPVYAIADTVKAGFNIMMDRDPQLTTAVTSTPENEQVTNYWVLPSASAEWVTRVVGDKKIVTCDGCGKSQATWGEGLLPSVQAVQDDVLIKLRDLLADPLLWDKAGLHAVSAPGMNISTRMLQSIRLMSLTEQEMAVKQMAQKIAVTRMVNQALLAKDILHRGKQLDSIAASDAAQVEIKAALVRFDEEIEKILKEMRVRQEVLGNTLKRIMAEANAVKARAMEHAPVSEAGPTLEAGALKP